MANKVFNMAGGLHSAAAYSAFENAMFGSCVATASDYVATAGTGMNVSLSTGNGLISTGTGFARRIASDAVNTIAITAAASTARIDAIVAYIDNSVTPTTSVVDNTNDVLKFTAVAGTAAATPSAPSAATIQSAIGAGNPYMVLWEVTIPANATALTGATFTDRRVIASPDTAISGLRAAIVAQRTTLFEGNRQGNTTLSDDWANYDEIEITYAANSSGTQGMIARFPGTATDISIQSTVAGGSNTAYLGFTRFSISGATLTRGNYYEKAIAASGVTTSSKDDVRFLKIVGIKYLTA